MQNKWIFLSKTCLDALNSKIQFAGSTRGYKAAMARAAQCQPAYLSQVLAGKAQLTLDHASGLSDFWMLSDLETQYFLTLTELSRAGTQGLKKKLEGRLTWLRNQHDSNSRRVEPEPASPEKAMHYYLDWSTAAIHILLTIPGFNDPKIIAKKLGIDEQRVFKSLAILSDLGIVSQNGKSWSLHSKHLHVSRENLFVSLHHRNWRDKAKEVILADKTPNNYHFTSVHTLAKSDFEKIREMIQAAVANTQTIIHDSNEEILGGLTVDWFEIG